MSVDFNLLFSNPQKICDTNFEAKVESEKCSNEIITVTLKNKNIEYRNINIIKGEIFPIPKKDNIISVYKVHYRYDDNFNLRLYISANINDNNNLFTFENITKIENKNKVDIFDFDVNCISKTLKSFFKIKDELFTNLFVVDSSKDNYYLLRCINNNKILLLFKNTNIINTPLNNNDFVLINDYHLEDTKIILSPMSIIEKLNEENLFILLEKKKEISNNALWGKILEIDKTKGIATLMDNNKNILEIKNINNDIKIGQFFLFSNYILDGKTKEVLFNNDSFCYYSSQDLYFSNKINLNSYSVFQFHFLDYKNNDDNIYKAVKIGTEIKSITSNKMDFIIENKKIKNYEVLTKEISLLEEKNDFIKCLRFDASYIQGFIKKINTFINYRNINDSFYYEYLYYSYLKFDFLDIKTIKINDCKTVISIYNNLSSENRREFNILNIPFQKEIENKTFKNENSLQVCETFYENPKKSKIFGIFQIKDIKANIPIMQMKNNVYDIYYDIFGSAYDYLSKSNQNHEEEQSKFIKELVDKYKNNKSNLEILQFNSIHLYEEEISLSQLKARIGIISSYYLSIPNKDSKKFEVFLNLREIVIKLKRYEKILTKDQILRIFIVFIKRKIEKGINTQLEVFSNLNENGSPYLLAYKLNLDEIKHIDEYSRLFSGYLQMDSYLLYNDFINGSSYSFSLEPIFILKHHLSSNYEPFIFTEKQDNNILAFTEVDTRATIINETQLFVRSKLEDVSLINDEKALKHHAFGISMVLRHVKNSHQKKNLKSSYLISPFYYCDNGNVKEIKFEQEKAFFTGENGNLIESLIIDDQTIIMSLAKDFIFGDLLDYKLFIAKDFDELKKRINTIREENNQYFSKFQTKNAFLNRTQQNEMKEINKNEDIKEKAMKIIKEKEWRLGDQIYSLDLIKEMILRKKKKNQYDTLPPILIEVDNQLSEKEENN